MKIKRFFALTISLLLIFSTLSAVAFAVYYDKTPTGDIVTSKDGLWQYYSGDHSLGAYLGKEKNITLPTEIDGYTVTGVGLKENDYVENITIPVSYVNFFLQAFRDFKNLKTVTFSQDYGKEYTIQRFDEQLFWGCKKLKKVVLPNKLEDERFYSPYLNKHINGGYLSDDIFYGCESLTDLTLPDNIVEIGASAFNGCSSLESITLPDGVLSVGENVFVGCSNLKSITLPDSLEYVNNTCFSSYDFVNDTGYSLEISPMAKIYISNNSPVYSGLIKEFENQDLNVAVVNTNAEESDIKGDINNDKAFNILDVTYYQKWIAKIIDKKYVNSNTLDYNGDGKTNINDATAMQRALAKKI